MDDSINSGQVFLWTKAGDTWYGIDGRDVLEIGGSGRVRSYRKRRPDFFRRRDDIAGIIRSISRDPATARAARRFPGLRVLEQDPFQCMISFVASSNSSIQKIRSSLANLCRSLGERAEFAGREFHTFPEPDVIAGARIDQIRRCGFGYRSRFVRDAARMVADGRIDLRRLKKLDYISAKEEIMAVPGIGAKVADCIMLFSLDKLEAFPIDRWTTRILQRYHGLGPETATMTPKQYDILHDRIVGHFGPYAGYAQQFLFKAEREDSQRGWL